MKFLRSNQDSALMNVLIYSCNSQVSGVIMDSLKSGSAIEANLAMSLNHSWPCDTLCHLRLYQQGHHRMWPLILEPEPEFKTNISSNNLLSLQYSVISNRKLTNTVILPLLQE